MKTGLRETLKYVMNLMSPGSRKDSRDPVARTTSLTKAWRVYAPEGRNISHDVKANLRTMSDNARLLGRGERYVSPKSRDDYGDDAYFMAVNREGVLIIARENGQTHHTGGVFDDRESGIFFYVSDKNFRDAEGKLVQAFGYAPNA